MVNPIPFLIINLLYTPLLAHASIWPIDIDEGPAPSPEDGPPFSAHASRNPALLPAQICGIIGAYFGAAFIMGSLLLTVGRRMRQAAQSTPVVVAKEMVKPTIKMFDDSPISPGSQRSWYSPRRLRKKRSMQSSTRSASNPGSPAVESVASFDMNVIEADKAARQQQLEQLYAAALAQEAAKSRTAVQETELPSPEATSSKQRRAPPRLLTSAPALSHLNVHGHQPSPISPRSPIRAIYPPESPLRQQLPSPTSPYRPDYPTSSYRPRSSRPRTSSLGSQGESRHPRRSLRGLRIHPTSMNRYPSGAGGDVSDEEVRTPLTPRYYTDPGIPHSPPPRSEAPTTPGTHDGYDMPVDAEEMDRIRAIPHAEPQRTHTYYHHEETVSNPPRGSYPNTSTSRPSGAYASPSNASATSTLGNLPFRNIPHHTEQAPLASPGLPMTRITYLERRRDLFAPQRTGLATPYSPYMPFTPVTPVTPHLTSRAERRQREREVGRRVLAEEDRVVEEDELWGSGY